MKTSLLFALCISLFAVAAQAKVSVTATQSFPLPATGAISLKNINGEITITGWDKNEVSLETVRTGKTQDDLDRTRVSAVVKDGELVIATELEKKGFLGNVDSSVRYHLHVPAGVTLKQISGTNSAVTVTGVTGAMTLSTTNGAVHASGVADDASLSTTNGSATAEVVSVQTVKKLSLKTTNGSVQLTLPKGAPASVHAYVTNGRVNIAQPIEVASKTKKPGRHSVTGQIGVGGPAVELQTTNGNVTLNEQ